MKFEWDEAEATTNLEKHGVSFDEASSTFADPNARIIDDPDHSADEERFIFLGLSLLTRVLVVCQCLRSDGEVIRILSARRATRREKKHIGGFTMRDEYDFKDSRPNPYVKDEKRPVTIRLDVAVIDHFKSLASETGIPYQRLINLYLRQCMVERRQLAFV